MSARDRASLGMGSSKGSPLRILFKAVAHLSTRLLIMVLFAGTALLVISWIGWQEAYPRGMSVIVLWVPMAAASWVLCAASVVAAGRGILALAVFALLPIVGIVLSVVFLSLRSQGDAGLVGVIMLLAAFDFGLLRVIHEVWNEIEGVR